MSQNFTIDDSDPTLVYTSGWGVDSTSDPALGNYFQSTYHATQTFGSNVSLSFSGSAIYLFGSKGPNRGTFSVRYDNLVQLLTARADTLSYRQLLFSAQLTQPGTHTLTLTYTDENQNWVDLDFVTVTGTASNTTTSSVVASTISPPPSPIVPTITEGSSPLASSSGAITTPASSVPTHNTPTFILAIVFGSLLVILSIIVAISLIRHRQTNRHRRRPSGTAPYYGSGTHGGGALDPQSIHSAGSAFLGPQSIRPLVPTGSSSQESSPTQGTTNFHAIAPVANLDMEMRQWRGSGNGNIISNSVPGHAVPLPTATTTRPWSPFTTPMNRMFGAVKDGADSMKSTFLKV